MRKRQPLNYSRGMFHHFTASQRDAWKSHFVAAFSEHGVRGGLLQDMADFVDRGMRFYGPIVGDRSVK